MSYLKKLTGFIPAGGQGSRLRPLTDATPKPLLQIGGEGRHLIDLPLELLSEHCAQTFVTTYYHAEAIEDYLKERRGIHILRNSNVLGNAGAFVERYNTLLELDPDGSVIIMPADHVIDGLSIEEFYVTHRAYDTDVTMLAVPPKAYGDYIIVRDGRALRITKEPSSEALSRAGIYIVKNSYLVDWAHRLIIAGWGNGQEKNITADLIDPAVETGRAAIFRLGKDGYWDDAGTFARYYENNFRLDSRQNKLLLETKILSEAK